MYLSLSLSVCLSLFHLIIYLLPISQFSKIVVSPFPVQISRNQSQAPQLARSLLQEGVLGVFSGSASQLLRPTFLLLWQAEQPWERAAK